MAKGITRRALAKQLKVSVSAVQKAIQTKRIPVLPDGSLDPETAEAAWVQRSEPARSRVRRDGQPPIETPDDARLAVALVRRVLEEEGAPAGEAIDFVSARIAETILRARERDLKLAQRRRELVELTPVREQVARAFVSLRQTWQNFPARHAAAIAAETGCDAGLLNAALAKAIASELTQLSTPVVRGD
jgi:hypothetical protein